MTLWTKADVAKAMVKECGFNLGAAHSILSHHNLHKYKEITLSRTVDRVVFEERIRRGMLPDTDFDFEELE